LSDGFCSQRLAIRSDDGSLKIPQEKLLDDILVLSAMASCNLGPVHIFCGAENLVAWPFYAIFRLPGFNWMLGKAIVGSIVTIPYLSPLPITAASQFWQRVEDSTQSTRDANLRNRRSAA